jgi:hypothetical protein
MRGHVLKSLHSSVQWGMKMSRSGITRDRIVIRGCVTIWEGPLPVIEGQGRVPRGSHICQKDYPTEHLSQGVCSSSWVCFSVHYLYEIYFQCLCFAHIFPQRSEESWILQCPSSYPASVKMEYSCSLSVDMTSGVRRWVGANIARAIGHTGRALATIQPLVSVATSCPGKRLWGRTSPWSPPAFRSAARPVYVRPCWPCLTCG